MATSAEVKAKIYKPGDTVEASGIYKVTHDPNHTEEHEVTVIYQSKFPPCNKCGQHPRFRAVRLAHHIDNNEFF
ncbi:MAG TPA: hypothetical protein VFE35_03850 [Candidatus Cybelea sp.]|jgi:hypothetical protein|nr:hypothetical protein [Candidatus Cybelea sp.]